ncbi:terminase family protein [Methylocystis sp. WRRC1]|nr:terminase family protein [Methylocystis sp. WRRC1]MCC3244676.1 terminase family protein [Methylocystis sp. WRRC1]
MLDGLSDCAANGLLNEAIDGLSAQELARLLNDWEFVARKDQWPPDLTEAGLPWRVWLILGGRGAGKTRAGAEWVKGLALGRPHFCARPVSRIALIGETAADVREVMIEGVSGLLAIHGKRDRPRWESSRRRLVWDSGVVAQAFSAEDPESLRGPQFHAAWCDELAKWRYARETWDMLQFGLRLGDWPRQLVTTTPRPTPLLKDLIAHPATVLTRALTRENAANLAPSFLESVVAQYAGTRLGRQELDGEIVEERKDALWTRDLIEASRVADAPRLARIVVAVDPPASSGKRADNCGIIAAGADAGGAIFVLADSTISAARPAQWARAAIALYHKLSADVLVAEVNQGGEMVRAVLNEADPAAPVTMVRATRGKYLRAAPVAQLYEQGRVKHVGAFPALEDEMCDFGFDGLSCGRSPDRLDALVWAITALALTPKAPEPRMRRV